MLILGMRFGELVSGDNDAGYGGREERTKLNALNFHVGIST